VKYKMVGEYTVIHVHESIVEAESYAEAYEKFRNELLNVDARNCSANHLGWDEVYEEEL
jgi:hypothetical protein